VCDEAFSFFFVKEKGKTASQETLTQLARQEKKKVHSPTNSMCGFLQPITTHNMTHGTW